jgi:hypothetical protein
MDYLSPLAPQMLVGLMHKTIRSFRLAGAWGGDPFSPGAYVEWVEMGVADEEPLRITTDRAGAITYGLALYRGAVQDPGSVLQWWEPDQGSQQWVQGKVIETVDLYFEKNALVGPADERGDRLQDVRLVLDDGVAVFLSAASWMSELNLKKAEDNVAVVYGEERARQLCLGPFGQLASESAR